MGWIDGMVITGHVSSKGTFGAKNTIKAGGSTAICKMLNGVGDGVDTP